MEVSFNKFFELALPSGIHARNPMSQGPNSSGGDGRKNDTDAIGGGRKSAIRAINNTGPSNR